MVKYPNITVKLVGEDGNAFSIISRVTSALRNGGVSKEERDLFQTEAMKGDYNHLLATVMEWVNEFEDVGDDEDEICDYCGYYVENCTCDEDDEADLYDDEESYQE